MSSTQPGFLDKERIIAGPGFNRWLVPPAALAIHLCIGMAYGFSVFWLPLSKALSTAGTGAACPKDMSFFAELFASGCDWRVATLGWMYTLFFVFLGCSAAIWGGWLERAGPRKAGVVSAVCWCGGMLLSALGIHLHQFWLMILGSGVIGGIGLGLGYISPVSTLIKWFPDRRGMATGMAIMGFGGGAMIGSPLAVDLMKRFSTPTDVGVMQTFVVMALLYFVFMMAGALGYRVPATGWKPAGWTPPPPSANTMITQRHVHVKRVWGIPQFWLVWVVLCMNVSAGIGVIGMASPMLQEVFGGALIGVPQKFGELDKAQLAAIAAVAGGFTALLSLFNIGGRFFWASLSDKLGRKMTYVVFFVLGGLLYASIPSSAGAGSKLLFVGAFCIILSMYGGGFATVPAYLADLFGTQFVGAIHGRLLTAWATAGILGPVVVNYMREYQLGLGLPREQVYNQTMYILVGMLVIGLIANLLVRPLADKWFMTDEELAHEKKLAHEKSLAAEVGSGTGAGSSTSPALVAFAWAAVGIPLAWGIYKTLVSAAKFFQ
ncbi:OFA family MFS transporter [Acidovorax sp. SUPP2522]|uniref:OFA family MFS transporter n=1 Tax=unclassified Acidovorax TaxID=2684926 RepID=UPI00234C0085|nr:MULTISPECIES: OFA family MFS transporter [Comamonadaceae]WCM96759.1 OFA family MFS transporter [Acidovorax sp. GBBC 1281]WOI45997.1 OFA family MFS transporter [Paracidovorax avenae]GKT19592.1 OFA family MFS transporter [Acidovorax sp. SUPP2522]